MACGDGGPVAEDPDAPANRPIEVASGIDAQGPERTGTLTASIELPEDFDGEVTQVAVVLYPQIIPWQQVPIVFPQVTFPPVVEPAMPLEIAVDLSMPATGTPEGEFYAAVIVYTQRESLYVPEFTDIAERIAIDAQQAARREANEAYYEDLKARYTISFPEPAAPADRPRAG